MNKRVFPAAYCYVLLGVVLLSPTHALTQHTSGTVVVVYFTDVKVILAADSLVGIEGRQGEKKHDCKIAIIDDHIVFANTGMGGVRVGVAPLWSAHEEARRAYKAVPDGSLRDIAHTWGAAMVGHFEVELRLTKGIVEGYAARHSSILALGVFFSNRVVDGFAGTVVTVRLSNDGRDSVSHEIEALYPRECRSPIGPFCAIGSTDVFVEFAALATDRARDEASSWEGQRPLRNWGDEDVLKTARLVDLTIAYDKSGSVGGNIDVVQLQKGGSPAEWKAQAEECRQK